MSELYVLWWHGDDLFPSFAAIFSVINQTVYRVSLSPGYSTLAWTYIIILPDRW